MSNNSFATATMQAPQLPPRDFYAKMLYPLHCGYPLWDTTIDCGDRQHSSHRCVGMVGFLEDGKFRPLFCSGTGEGTDSNEVPSPLKELRDRFGPCVSVRTDKDRPRELESFNPENGFVKFASRGRIPEQGSDQGAILKLPAGSTTYFFNNKWHIVRYMHEKIDKWLALANSIGDSELKDEDIMFVTGATWTTQFTRNLYQSQYIRGNVDVPTSIMTTPQTEGDPAVFKFAAGQPQQSEIPHFYPSSPVSHHCVFMNYYKIKRRPKNHGPSERGSEGTLSQQTSVLKESPWVWVPRPTFADPVNALLDYILEDERVNIAVASDSDVYKFLEYRQAVPDDIRTLLISKGVCTAIVRDLEQVGTVQRLQRKNARMKVDDDWVWVKPPQDHM
ncbi:hypothetical protein BD310DRAFT_940186 [Dichomitus squalens]|uniref:Uncharacterized protein n=2 Tax=Dichomitus squalens TaxID=114155 RepID=A0A4Q9PED6_9APHY|nr:hypothetical protein BD310DRAFT_940186 [Dichomitus squalens]